MANQGSLWPQEKLKYIASIYLCLQSLPILFLLWIGAAGLGIPLRHWLVPCAEDGQIIQVATGLGAMLTLDWLLALAGWLNSVTVWMICALGGLLLVGQLARQTNRSLTGAQLPWTLLLGLPILGLLLVACTCPPGTLWQVEGKAYDVLSYHLQVPREWLDLNRMTGLQHNIYSYLPLLNEAGFMQAALMKGSVNDALYLTQFYHTSVGVLAAIALWRLASRWTSTTASALAVAVFLAVPWTMITATLAYNEMFMLAFGAVALLVLFDPTTMTRRGALMVGLLIGWSTMSKLTAGPMIALPIGLIMLLRLNQSDSKGQESNTRHVMMLVAVVALGATLAISPYLIRNAAWTGNPVFPFAANSLGTGHWDQTLIERWNAAHKANHYQVTSGIEALGSQWFFNKGYGSVGGLPPEAGLQEVARFDREGGLPLLWGGVLIAIVVALQSPKQRRLTMAMLGMIAVQITFWMLATHHQSRFLMPTLLPGCILIGLGFGWIEQTFRDRWGWLFAASAISLVMALTVNSYGVFYLQTPPNIGKQFGNRPTLQPWTVVDSLLSLDEQSLYKGPEVVQGDHVLNYLPPDSRVYIVANVRFLLYIRLRVPDQLVYHSAFDASPLGNIIRKQNHDPMQITQALLDAGFTHVLVGWQELERLHRRYGYDPDVTAAQLRMIAEIAWQPMAHYRFSSLYKLPSP